MPPLLRCPLYPPNMVCTHVVMPEKKMWPGLQMLCRLYTELLFQSVLVMGGFAVNMHLTPAIHCIFMDLNKEFIAS